MSRQRISVTLKDKTGRFYDPKTKFRIKLKEEKELTYPLGEATRQWLNAGGLVISQPTLPPPIETASIISTDTARINAPETPQAPENDRYDYMPVGELRRAAKSKGIKMSRSDTAQTIRLKLRAAR